MAVYSWPSDAAKFCTSGQTMVQTPESATEAVLNPNDLRASGGQAMVQFAAKRWFKSQLLAAPAPPTMIWKEYPPDMSQQLLLSACEQAERSETAVRAAALMHIARVLARSDQAAAEQTTGTGYRSG
jgi:hypothetical protein